MSGIGPDVRAIAARNRLAELIPSIFETSSTLHSIINHEIGGAPTGDDPDGPALWRLEGKISEFHVGILKDKITTSRSYFHDLGLGPDAESLLTEASNFERDWKDYWQERLNGASAEAMHDRALILLCGQLGIDEATKRLWNASLAAAQRFLEPFPLWDGTLGRTIGGGAVAIRACEENPRFEFGRVRPRPFFLKAEAPRLFSFCRLQ